MEFADAAALATCVDGLRFVVSMIPGKVCHLHLVTDDGRGGRPQSSPASPDDEDNDAVNVIVLVVT